MNQLKIFNIEWDTEQEDGSRPEAAELGLPDEVAVDLETLDLEEEELMDDDAVTNAVNDYLSNEYGYCTESWDWEYKLV